MEREILYRGKRKDNGEWIESLTLFQLDENLYMLQTAWADITYDLQYNITAILGRKKPFLVEVIPSTVGQYTGLTDKNGVEIFEGDILRSNNNPKDIRQVIFGEFMVIDFETESETDEVTGWYCEVIHTDALSRIRPFCFTLPLTDYYIHQCNMEVVSNIHDNPEML